MKLTIEEGRAKTLEGVSKLAEKLDFLDIQLLRKFYVTGKSFPSDTQPHCFPLLYKEMKDARQLSIGKEGLRKRLENLKKVGLLGKVKHSNPIIYTPIKEKEEFVRAIIAKFFLIHGLTKFL
jgi:hypothetical protein